MATAKKTGKNSNKKQRRDTKSISREVKSEKNNSEIYGIVAIACSLIFMFSLYTNKLGYLSTISKEIFITLFGIGAFLIPIFCLYISVKHYFLKQKLTITRKYWGISGIVIVSIILIQTINMKLYVDKDIINSFGKFLVSNTYLHGGFITFIIILPLYKLIGDVGIYILIAAAYVICSILVFNYNIRGVAYDVHSKGKKIQKKATKKINTQREKLSNIKVANRNTQVRNNNESNNIDDTISDNNLRSEVENRMKMIDFMNNVTLEENDKDEEVLEISNDNIKEKKNNESLEVIEVLDFSRIKNEEIRKDSVESKIIMETRDTSVKDETIHNDISVAKEKEIERVPVIKTEKVRYAEKNESEDIIDEGIIKKNEYLFPTADLLKVNTRSEMTPEEKQELLRNANKLEEVLLSFGVQAELLNVTKGPSVTRYEIQPRAGIKVNKIVNLSNDIALGLAAAGAVRIEAPIPGKAAVGIEVPNLKQTPVYFREIIETNDFNDSKSNVACALGKSIEGKPVVVDLSAMPHLLIAGATGSGKSVCINTLIVSILYKYSPDEVKLLMVDPKVVELSVYNGIPHLLIPVVTDPKKASGALFWAVKEMDRRYNLFAENGARNIGSYNNMIEIGRVKNGERLPYIVIIVDELADLMMVCPGDVEDYICRLAQKARAAGMHLVIATQRPSVDVITGVIKANIPSRISFSVSSQIDSRTILDSTGAEKLLGRGDMLFHPIGKSGNMRVQGAFISEEEVEQVVEHVKCLENTISNNYEEEINKHMESAVSGGKGGSSSDDQDDLIDEAIKLIVDSGQVSASFIQRRLKIGFNRAARMIEQMEEMGIISEKDGNKPRHVLISKEEIENL